MNKTMHTEQTKPMKRTKHMKAITAMLAGAVLACASGVALAKDGVPNKTFRWAHFSAENWGSSNADKLFVEELKKRTDGKFKARFYWAGSLGSGTELLELTANKAVDVGSFVPAYYPRQLPLMALPDSLPLTWADPIDAMETQRYLVENNKFVQEELQRNNIYPIVFHGLAPYRLQCTMPIRNLEDLKGKRIRTFGEWPPYMFEKLGAIPVNIGMIEVYENLQRGSLDCSYNSTEAAGFLKIAEVAKFWSDINLGAIAAYSSFVNKEVYDSWSDEFKSKIREAAAIAEAYEKSQFVELEEQTLKRATEQGVQIVRFEDQEKLREVIPDLLEVWKTSMCDRNQCEAAESVVADIKKLKEQKK